MFRKYLRNPLQTLSARISPAPWGIASAAFPQALPKRAYFDNAQGDGNLLHEVKKRELVEAILDRLREDLDLYHKAAGAARAEATHEQSKAENKYDTRGLEASYLARGQSRQAAELATAIERFEKLPIRDFGPSDPIDTGAVVDLQNGKETNSYFIGPRAGGTEITVGKREILVITPESPLGSQLLGKRVGDKCMLELGGKKQQLKVTSIQ